MDLNPRVRHLLQALLLILLGEVDAHRGDLGARVPYDRPVLPGQPVPGLHAHHEVQVLDRVAQVVPVLDHVADGYPAYEAGLRQGDKIFSINEHPIRDWADVVESISESKNEYIVIGVLRDGAEVIVKSDTILNEEGRRVIGISPMLVHTPLLGIREAFRTTSYMMSAMGHFIVQLFSGKASSSDIVGPIGVVTIIGQQAKYGWLNVLHLMAMISLNLGIVNLLPFPALDGGRMLFVVIRGLSGGRISDELEATVHTIGMVLLLGLMVFLIFKDTMQFIL